MGTSIHDHEFLRQVMLIAKILTGISWVKHGRVGTIRNKFDLASAMLLAAATHGFYHDCPILSPDTPEPLRQARWWLADAAGVGLQVGLSLLGVSAPESM